MTIQFHCSHCKTALCIDHQYVGKQVRCPQCQTLNLVKESMQFSENNPDQNEPIGSPKDLYSESFQPAPATPSRKLQPHQGGMILTLGIVSLFCNICLIPGLLAWMLGTQDMRKMDNGIMESDGRGLTQAGMIIGMVMTCLFLLSVFGWILMAMVFAII